MAAPFMANGLTSANDRNSGQGRSRTNLGRKQSNDSDLLPVKHPPASTPSFSKEDPAHRNDADGEGCSFERCAEQRKEGKPDHQQKHPNSYRLPPTASHPQRQKLGFGFNRCVAMDEIAELLPSIQIGPGANRSARGANCKRDAGVLDLSHVGPRDLCKLSQTNVSNRVGRHFEPARHRPEHRGASRGDQGEEYGEAP